MRYNQDCRASKWNNIKKTWTTSEVIVAALLWVKVTRFSFRRHLKLSCLPLLAQSFRFIPFFSAGHWPIRASGCRALSWAAVCWLHGVPGDLSGSHPSDRGKCHTVFFYFLLHDEDGESSLWPMVNSLDMLTSCSTVKRLISAFFWWQQEF